MPVKNPFLMYLRSRLNLVLSIVGGSLILLSFVFLGGSGAYPALVILAAYGALTAAFFYSKRGAREVVTEEEEDQRKKVRERIQKYSGLRERIAVLRIGDERMVKAIEYFLQESGAYLEECRRQGLYSPVANERIERVLEICQVFLGETDESSTGRRYGIAEGSSEADAGSPSERFSRDIVECAGVIKQRTTEDLLGQSGAERLSILKELEEKK